MRSDARKGFRQIAEHQLGLHAQHGVAGSRQRAIAARVRALPVLVVAAIDLDDERTSGASRSAM